MDPGGDRSVDGDVKSANVKSPQRVAVVISMMRMDKANLKMGLGLLDNLLLPFGHGTCFNLASGECIGPA